LKLAFCLFKYFPYGGLQRDFLHIAQACQNRGHSIHVYTMSWEGDVPQSFEVSLIPVRGWTNHRRCSNFSTKVTEYLKKDIHDIVIGFNKMQGLNIYYAADSCYKARAIQEKNLFYRMGSRYRTYLMLEKAVFAPSSNTHIMLISEKEKTRYLKYYGTSDERFHDLPPGISRDRVITDNAGEIRRNTRNELGIGEDGILLLMVASSFKTKGLDRTLLGFAGLPDSIRSRTKLVVIGQGKAGNFENMAKRLNVAGGLFFLGGRKDVPRFMTAADLLVHPAYSENAGTVLIEAMAAGLPVLVTDICGYAFHIERARAGLLVSSPFEQKAFNELLRQMITSPEREIWQRNGIDYVSKNDFFSRPEKAADIIESLAAKGSRR
jgi:UDP-glucose:(heptosyl)LPS alpha-1,3-glucosyltransferase